MGDVMPFARVLLVLAAVVLAAALSGNLVRWLRTPAAVLFLAGAAVAVRVVPDLHAPAERSVLRLVTVALVVILFDGGMHIGRRRFRRAKGAILSLGVLGTFATAAGLAVAAHLVTGLDWYTSALLATALAPTDPAIVFSVLGRREIAGRSGTILEGESGANDPVGIALMASLISAGGLGGSALGHVVGQFALEMVVGAAIGVVGGALLLWFMRRVPLAGEGLYPIRALAGAFALYALATLAHGSGFLAVFAAGIVIGDEAAPYKGEVRRFHTALASLAEIAAFVALGMTVDLSVLSHVDVWASGLALAALLGLVVRPLLAGPCLLPARLRPNEVVFTLFAGLKGAVPILLGGYVLAAHLPAAQRVYGIVIVVVVVNVAVQGGLVPTAASVLRLPMRQAEPRSECRAPQ